MFNPTRSTLVTPKPGARAWLLVAVACLVTLAAGCGSDNKSSSLCKNLQALESSVQELKNVDVVKNGTSSLQSALDNVKRDAAATAQDAKDEFKPQVDALQNALTSLATALKNVTTTGVAAVQQAARSVQTAATDLQNAVTAKKC